MPKDFSGQNLRGRSFKGQNLEGADFSRSDIRGANFTNAILREANFTEAKAGLQDRWSLTRLGILFVMSYTALSLSMSFCLTVINYLIYSGTGGWVGIWWTVLILFFYTALFFTLVNQGFTIRAFRTVLNTAVFLYLLIFLTTCSRSVSSGDFSPVLVTVLGVIVIRTFSMISASVRGTNFRGADLTGANFYMAWLRNTDFEEANLNWTYWYLARKIDFIIQLRLRWLV